MHKLKSENEKYSLVSLQVTYLTIPIKNVILYFTDIRTTTVCPIGFFFKLSHVKTLQEYFWIEKLGKLANSLVNQEALKEKTKGGENKKWSL